MLKFKNFLSISIFVFGVIVFFTSCSDTEIAEISEEIAVDDPSVIVDGTEEFYLPPKGVENDNAYFEELIQSGNVEILEAFKNNYRIAQYLESIGQKDNIYNDMENGMLFQDIDFTIYLTTEQIEDLNSHTISTIESIEDRHCIKIIYDFTDNSCENDCKRCVYYEHCPPYNNGWRCFCLYTACL